MGFEHKDDLKALLPEYMELLASEGKTEYRGDGYWVCPYCNSGNGQNNSAAFHVDGAKFYCFSCGAHGDIFDLVAHINDLPNDWRKHYNRAMKIMRPYLEDKKDTVVIEKKPETIQEEDYSIYLSWCHSNVYKTAYFRKRGLSEGIIDRFKLGYDPDKNVVTMPYNASGSGYVHRILWDSTNKYCKFGNEIFNINALYSGDSKYIFIAEGQIDAMSLEEIGCSAIGLGGVNEVGKLVDQLKWRPCYKTLVLALDNDLAGRKATARLIEKLAESGFGYPCIYDSRLYGKYKDANEFLIADRDGFKERILKVMG
jgi:replicative DNA helicase